MIGTADDPVMGWADNIYGLNGVIAGVAFGILRIMLINDKINADIIPADFVVNLILTSAWNTHHEKSVSKSENQVAKIYNCASSVENPINFELIYKYSIYVGKKIPPINGIWIVSWRTTTNVFVHTILRFLYHTIPAFFMDLYLRMIGKKPR